MTFADAVYVEGNVDELDAVVAVAAVAVDDMLLVLSTNIIQPSCHNEKATKSPH